MFPQDVLQGLWALAMETAGDQLRGTHQWTIVRFMEFWEQRACCAFCCRWLVVLFVQLSGGWSVHLGLGTVGDRPHDADPPASASAARGRPWPLRTPARCLEQLRSLPSPLPPWLPRHRPFCTHSLAQSHMSEAARYAAWYLHTFGRMAFVRLWWSSTACVLFLRLGCLIPEGW